MDRDGLRTIVRTLFARIAECRLRVFTTECGADHQDDIEDISRTRAVGIGPAVMSTRNVNCGGSAAEGHIDSVHRILNID